MTPVQAIAVDPADNVLAGGDGPTLQLVSPTQALTNIAGTGTEGYTGDGGPSISAEIGSIFGIDPDGMLNIYFTENKTDAVRVLRP